MTIEVHTDGADILAEKLKGLPQKLQTKISRVILKEALKETGAREELTGYIDTHFKSHTGIYRKSVSGIKTSRVRSDHNRIISYIHFLPVSKVKGSKEGKKAHMPPAQVLKAIKSFSSLSPTNTKLPSTEPDSISPLPKHRNSGISTRA